MPRGDKSKYTDKQKRQAEHIEEGYEDRGVGKQESERRAWATVNAMTHGGKKSGSGRGRSEDHSAARQEVGSHHDHEHVEDRNGNIQEGKGVDDEDCQPNRNRGEG